MDFRFKKRLFVSALTIVMLIYSQVSFADGYSVTLLNGPSGQSVYATGINNNGDVIGDTSGGQAVLWKAGSTTPIVLGGLWNGGSTFATSINNNGQIVGYSAINNHMYEAILWQLGSTTPIDLGTLQAPLGGGGFATSINDSGQVVGYAQNTSSYITDAVSWQVGMPTVTDLGTLTPSNSNSSSQANGINASGQVVGQSTSLLGGEHAALWEPSSTTPIDLGGLGTVNGSSIAKAINASGEIIGYGNSGNLNDNSTHALMWQPGSTIPIDLGSSGTSVYDYYLPMAINASGQIVGDHYNIPILWQPGSITPIDLSTLVSGYNLVGASTISINDMGQIALSAYVNGVGVGVAAILTPNVAAVPVPATVWLFGSALVGFVGFNRRKLA